MQEQIREILKEKVHPPKFSERKLRRVNAEFISANPTGPLHIGNGRGAFFGDCLSNVLEKAGYKVTREYYINDARTSLQIITLKNTVSQVGEGKLPILFEKLPYYSEYLQEKISELKTPDKVVTGIQKDIKSFIEKKLKIKFDNWVSEEDLYRKNEIKKIYEILKKKGLVYQKEGAEWLKITKFGASKDEVIIRQTGEPTYFLSDIAYHQDKFKRGFSKIINIWGADHQGHIPKMKAAAKILGYKGTLDILISQIVRLSKGKISKRKGEIIGLEWLVDEVGLDAARFFYLMKSLNTQMDFNVELAKEKSSKSPVYYVQYAHARIASILRKAPKYKIQDTNYKLLDHPSELNLIKELMRFPEVIEDTARDYQVQRIPQYAIDLATVFHQFYRNCKVLTDDKNLTEVRLSLMLATKQVLKNTLNLMGIFAPEKM